jgi:hypothetical protein
VLVLICCSAENIQTTGCSSSGDYGTEHEPRIPKKITSEVNGQFQTLGQWVQDVRDVVSAERNCSEATSSKLCRQVTITQKSVHSGNPNVIKQHNKTRDQTLQSKTEAIETIYSNMEELLGNLAERYISARKSGRRIRFSGHSREAMVSPLLLLKTVLRSAIL